MTRAVILAGGRGTRLRPYTLSLPKPLMPIVDKPILEIIIHQLAQSGFDHLTLAVNHQAELLKAYFGDGSRWNVRIGYSLEAEPLSTMAPLRLIGDLPDNFLVMNGDILTDLDCRAFLETHVASGDIFTIAAADRKETIDYGVLEIATDNRLCGFSEKPSIPFTVSMGVYCASRKVLEFIPPGRPFGFDGLMLELIARDQSVRVVRHNGYWVDIGRPDDYEQAVKDWPRLSKALGQ